MTASCIFCKIAMKEIPARVVYEDADVMAFHDQNPEKAVHILVIPKQHARDIVQLSDDAPLLAKVVAVSGEIAEQFSGGEFKLLFNTGKNAGQSVFHAHGHILADKIEGEVNAT
jgi:histidine triad (HIT) family protein